MTATETTTPSADGQLRVAPPRRGRRVPALDGLRGFALIGMLLWHAEVSWVEGGFARMTIFFALSGYLATGSWQRIRQGSPSGAFRTFWWRRARRLLPVSFLGIALAVAVTAVAGTASMQRNLGADVVSVLAYVSNIRFWRSGQSYGELFTEPSLLQHYWTLSIEEQAFFVLPLLLAGVGLASRGRPRVAAVGVALLGAACAGLPAVVDHTPDAVWYSSIVRLGEFCGGVALALWTTGTRRRAARADAVVSAAGAAALASIVLVMLTVPRTAAWLYQGGMALVIVPSVVVLAAASRSLGPAAAVLGWRPLVLLGRWTFSIYVVHWPLFWVLDSGRLGLDGWRLATVRLLAAVVIGGVVHVLIERPLMVRGPVAETGTGFAGAQGRRDALDRWLAAHVPSGWWRTRPAALSLVALGVVLATLGSVVPVSSEHHTGALLDEPPVEQDWITSAGMQMVEPVPGRIELSVFGGSSALALATGAMEWLRESELIAPRPGVTPLGCGLVNAGERAVPSDVTGELTYLPPNDICDEWPELWEEVARISESEVALVMVGVWDTGDFDIDGEAPLHVGVPEFDARLDAHLEQARALLVGAGIDQVQLATTPVVRRGAGGRLWERRGLDDSHPERVRRFNDLLRRFADRHDDVAIVDYAGWVASLDDTTVKELLPDGVHATEASAPRIWEEFLAEAVAEQYLGEPPGAG